MQIDLFNDLMGPICIDPSFPKKKNIWIITVNKFLYLVKEAFSTSTSDILANSFHCSLKVWKFPVSYPCFFSPIIDKFPVYWHLPSINLNNWHLPSINLNIILSVYLKKKVLYTWFKNYPRACYHYPKYHKDLICKNNSKF